MEPVKTATYLAVFSNEGNCEDGIFPSSAYPALSYSKTYTQKSQRVFNCESPINFQVIYLGEENISTDGKDLTSQVNLFFLQKVKDAYTDYAKKVSPPFYGSVVHILTTQKGDKIESWVTSIAHRWLAFNSSRTEFSIFVKMKPPGGKTLILSAFQKKEELGVPATLPTSLGLMIPPLRLVVENMMGVFQITQEELDQLENLHDLYQLNVGMKIGEGTVVNASLVVQGRRTPTEADKKSLAKTSFVTNNRLVTWIVVTIDCSKINSSQDELEALINSEHFHYINPAKNLKFIDLTASLKVKKDELMNASIKALVQDFITQFSYTLELIVKAAKTARRIFYPSAFPLENSGELSIFTCASYVPLKKKKEVDPYINSHFKSFLLGCIITAFVLFLFKRLTSK